MRDLLMEFSLGTKRERESKSLRVGVRIRNREKGGKKGGKFFSTRQRWKSGLFGVQQ